MREGFDAPSRVIDRENHTHTILGCAGVMVFLSMNDSNKSQKSRKSGKRTVDLDRVQKIATIVATVLVPVILAIGGWIIQTSIEHEKVSAADLQTQLQTGIEKQRVALEYVKLAKDILTSDKPSPKELSAWSWRLIDDQSPTKFDAADLQRLIESDAKIPPPVSGGTRPTLSEGLDGFVILVLRTRTERNAQGRSRTVGYYHAFFNGQKLPDLEGMTLESRGPGDNSSPRGTRIEARTYPLFTHEGANYETIGYSANADTSAGPRPAIEIGDTGNRMNILIHPGQGFLTAIGTINLSRPLDGPSSPISYEDSRQRVIALIDAMKEKLGNAFPSQNGAKIPRAWIVIAGEPVDVNSAEAGSPDN